MNFTVYSKEDCPFCYKIKTVLELTGNNFVVYNLGEHFTKEEFYAEFGEGSAFPQVICGEKQMTCGCLEKMYHNVMLPNGDVSLCCMDYGLKHILGNLYEQDYEEIIPENNQCFELCRLCENAVEP